MTGGRSSEGEGAVLRIEASTIADVDGWRVGVGNVRTDRVRPPDAPPDSATSVDLFLVDPRGRESRVAVTAGSRVTLAGTTWRVSAVRTAPPPGHVEFERAAGSAAV